MSKGILVVCSGNTCRSPMAVGLIRQLWSDEVRIESAGMETAVGLPAAENAVLAMKELGIDISDHCSRPIETIDLRRYDVVIAMNSAIASTLCGMGVDPSRIVALEVTDPYGGDLQVYRSTAGELAAKLLAMRQERQ